MNPVIIAVGFSRHTALQRLLNSINDAHYPDQNVQLIISLDGGASEKVLEVARNFCFVHGNKQVVEREKNIGLRNHILWCGDQTATYDSVIVLEDDAMVDPWFFYYTQAALTAYYNEPRIAGIALYSPRLNTYARLPFEPMHNGANGYFMQVACSLGQAWTNSQWQKFRQWYNSCTTSDVLDCINLPEQVKIWPESSWKKYYAAYIALNNFYFFYPYMSYTTNCSDAGGTHVVLGTGIHHVPLPAFNRPLETFSFPDIEDRSVSYDPFMEPSSKEVFDRLGLKPADVEVDFYGSKPLSLIKAKPYVLSSRKISPAERIFVLEYRPFEKTLFNEAGLDGLKPDDNKLIYFGKSQYLKEDAYVFYKIAAYFSYFDAITLRFLKGYAKDFLKKIRQTLFRK